MLRVPAAVPEIPVSDVSASVHYYRDKLGFTIDWLEADIELAGISRDDCRLFLAGRRFRQELGSASPVMIWLNLHGTAEVDELHRAWRATGAILLTNPESKPWGLHEFTAADPDGNRFRVFYDVATPERELARSTTTGGTTPPTA